MIEQRDGFDDESPDDEGFSGCYMGFLIVCTYASLALTGVGILGLMFAIRCLVGSPAKTFERAFWVVWLPPLLLFVGTSLHKFASRRMLSYLDDEIRTMESLQQKPEDKASLQDDGADKK